MRVFITRTISINDSFDFLNRIIPFKLYAFYSANVGANIMMIMIVLFARGFRAVAPTIYPSQSRQHHHSINSGACSKDTCLSMRLDRHSNPAPLYRCQIVNTIDKLKCRIKITLTLTLNEDND